MFTNPQESHCGLSDRGHVSLRTTQLVSSLHSNRSEQRHAAQRSPPLQSAVSLGPHNLFPSNEINTTFWLTEFKEGAGNEFQQIKFSASRRKFIMQKTGSEQRQLPDKIMSLYVPM
jgi:hypothetical protein